MLIINSGEDTECLSTSDCHDNEHISVLLVLDISERTIAGDNQLCVDEWRNMNNSQAWEQFKLFIDEEVIGIVCYYYASFVWFVIG